MRVSTVQAKQTNQAHICRAFTSSLSSTGLKNAGLTVKLGEERTGSGPTVVGFLF
jgi:hypothetical protein